MKRKTVILQNKKNMSNENLAIYDINEIASDEEIVNKKNRHSFAHKDRKSITEEKMNYKKQLKSF